MSSTTCRRGSDACDEWRVSYLAFKDLVWKQRALVDVVELPRKILRKKKKKKTSVEVTASEHFFFIATPRATHHGGSRTHVECT